MWKASETADGRRMRLNDVWSVIVPCGASGITCAQTNKLAIHTCTVSGALRPGLSNISPLLSVNYSVKYVFSVVFRTLKRRCQLIDLSASFLFYQYLSLHLRLCFSFIF